MSPLKAPHPCVIPGCAALVTSGARCAEHEREHEDVERKRRGRPASRGRAWRQYSLAFRRANPLCALCQQEGRTAASAHVDHIQRVSGPEDPAFWDPKNHRAICASCHSRKTASEDGGFGNARRPSASTEQPDRHRPDTGIPVSGGAWLV